MDFRGDFYDYPIVGCGMAAAFAPVRGADCIHVVRNRVSRLWKWCGPDWLRRVRFQFAESTAGAVRSFRHATGSGHFSDRTFDLGKNQDRRAVANTGPMADVWFADGWNVDKGSDRLGVFASGHRCLSIAQAQD